MTLDKVEALGKKMVAGKVRGGSPETREDGAWVGKSRILNHLSSLVGFESYMFVHQKE